jgi:ligand-binding sensor domain-containing protein/serine/threonine protein kinase
MMKRPFWFRVAVLGVTLTHGTIESYQDYTDVEANVRFRRIGVEDGLSQASARVALQDRQGVMWVGTQEGLNRYDGYEFTVFQPQPNDPESLSHPEVRALFEDRAGLLWVGTRGGLNRFDRVTGRFVRYEADARDPTSLSHNDVRVIREDAGGALWIGTEDGLNRFDTERQVFERFRHEESDPASLGSNLVLTIEHTRDGALWIGTAGGLYRRKAGSSDFVRYVHDAAQPGTPGLTDVRALHEDRSGALWIGSSDMGLARLDRGTSTLEHFRHDSQDPQSLPSDTVRDVYQDTRGTVWIATDGGLCVYRPGNRSFVRYEHDIADPMSLSDNRTTFIYEDRGSVLWVGTYNGINTWRLGSGFFRHYKAYGKSSNELSGNVVQSFAESSDGAIWIGTYGHGLNRLDRESGRFTHYRADRRDATKLSDDRVMSLTVDRDDVLWIGTLDEGLDRFDPASRVLTHFRHDPKDPKSLSHNSVTRIYEDPARRLWVGTYRGGLNLLDRRTGEFLRFQHDPSNPASLSDDRVISIEGGDHGELWIGTDGGGLNKLDPESRLFTRYAHDPSDPESLSSMRVWAILRDRRSRLWIGTQGGGINRLDPGPGSAADVRFKRYGTKEGLPSAVVNGILEDDLGNLWISTNRGISRFNFESQQIKNYDTRDGLQSLDFNQGAFFRAADGELLFGGPNGFNRFYPQSIRENTHLPPVMLTAFLKFNQPAELGKPLADLREILLSHRDNVVAFEFAALDYAAPEKNHYRYRLEGFDDDWIDAGRLRRATYTNLPAGTYDFRVIASNNDGVWNEEGLAIGIEILPPPWRTWWAYATYLLAAGGAAVAYVRRQRKAIRSLREEVQEARRLGQYTLEEKLGEGGMGVVFRASHSMLRRPTAIKLMRPERVGKRSMARFEREVQLTSQLSHPNTVTIYDYGRTPAGALYYVMEYLDGLNLDQLVSDEGAQPGSRVIHVLQQICLSLREAHSVGLIHRDVKPANVFLCQRGGDYDVVKVLDFGLVKAMAAQDLQGLTHAEIIPGTPLFMAPEAFDPMAPPSIQADIYAVGAVGYYLLTGTVVFQAATLLDLAKMHASQAVERPSLRLGRTVSASLENVILSCLGKRAAERPRSAEELHGLLASCHDVPRWTKEDAEAWWLRRKQNRQSQASQVRDYLDVDFSGRTTQLRSVEEDEGAEK